MNNVRAWEYYNHTIAITNGYRIVRSWRWVALFVCNTLWFVQCECGLTGSRFDEDNAEATEDKC